MTRALETVLDESNPNKADSALQALKAGQAFGQLPLLVAGAVATNVLVLPTNSKAGQIIRAYARVGGTLGYKIIDAVETAAPAAGHVAVNANGDILFAAADAVTDAEVVYSPIEGEVYADSVPVAASAATFLQSRRGLLLVSVSVVTGVIPGAKIVDARGTAAPAAGHVALNAAGTGVVFNAADVVAGTALLTYVAVPGVGNGPLPSIANRLAGQVSM